MARPWSSAPICRCDTGSRPAVPLTPPWSHEIRLSPAMRYRLLTCAATLPARDRSDVREVVGPAGDLRRRAGDLRPCIPGRRRTGGVLETGARLGSGVAVPSPGSPPRAAKETVGMTAAAGASRVPDGLAGPVALGGRRRWTGRGHGPGVAQGGVLPGCSRRWPRASPPGGDRHRRRVGLAGGVRAVSAGWWRRCRAAPVLLVVSGAVAGLVMGAVPAPPRQPPSGAAVRPPGAGWSQTPRPGPAMVLVFLGATLPDAG